MPAPFTCEPAQPLGGDAARLRIVSALGEETRTVSLGIVRRKRHRLTDTGLVTATGETIPADGVAYDRVDYRIPANGRLILKWE